MNTLRIPHTPGPYEKKGCQTADVSHTINLAVSDLMEIIAHTLNADTSTPL